MLASIGSIQGGTGFYAGLTGSILVGGGITASLGLVQDRTGHVETYFTLGGGLGFGVSGGIEGGAIIPTDPNHTFLLLNLEVQVLHILEAKDLLMALLEEHLVINIRGLKMLIILICLILEYTLQMDTEPKALELLKGSAGLPVSWAKQILG